MTVDTPFYRAALPPVVGEGLVRLRHTVGVLAPLDRRPLSLRRVHDLVRELLGHGLARPGARRRDQPAHRQRDAAIAPYLDRHLVGRAADPPRLNLEDRR